MTSERTRYVLLCSGFSASQKLRRCLKLNYRFPGILIIHRTSFRYRSILGLFDVSCFKRNSSRSHRQCHQVDTSSPDFMMHTSAQLYSSSYPIDNGPRRVYLLCVTDFNQCLCSGGGSVGLRSLNSPSIHRLARSAGQVPTVKASLLGIFVPGTPIQLARISVYPVKESQG